MCGVGEDEEDIDAEEGEAGRRRTVKLANPARPSREEVEEHEKTHLPYRNWCGHCVKGHGVEAACRTSGGGGELPEFHLDWAFPGDEEGGKGLTMLVVRMRDVRMTMSSLAPSKSTGEFIARRVVAFMKECGCEGGDLVVKSDHESATVALLEKVARVRAEKGAGRTVIEHSPVNSSKSNGVVERAVRSVEEQMRTMRGALDGR